MHTSHGMDGWSRKRTLSMSASESWLQDVKPQHETVQHDGETEMIRRHVPARIYQKRHTSVDSENVVDGTNEEEEEERDEQQQQKHEMHENAGDEEGGKENDEHEEDDTSEDGMIDKSLQEVETTSKSKAVALKASIVSHPINTTSALLPDDVGPTTSTASPLTDDDFLWNDPLHSAQLLSKRRLVLSLLANRRLRHDSQQLNTLIQSYPDVMMHVEEALTARTIQRRARLQKVPRDLSVHAW